MPIPATHPCAAHIIRRPLKCYPTHQTCTLSSACGTSQAQLVDLNARTARLRFADAIAAGLFTYRQALTLDTALKVNGQRLSAIPCRMTWKFDTEIGLEFAHPLHCGLTDIQTSLNADGAA